MPGTIKMGEILVLLAATAGVFPLYPHLDMVSKIILPLFALTGAVAFRKNRPLPRIFLSIVAIAIFFYYAPRFSHNNVAAPAANLLVSFLAVRMADERSSRLYLQICGLSILCLAASTLFTLGPAFLFSLLLLSFLVISTLILMTFHALDPSLNLDRTELGSLGKLTLITTAVTLPLMLIFFFILPRTQFPLWNAFAGKSARGGGIAESVAPGKYDRIDQNRTIAFRVVTPAIDNENLYWRSVIFNSYTAGEWVRKAPPGGETSITPSGGRVQQTIISEPGSMRYLPALDKPIQITAVRASTSGDMVTTQSFRGSGRTRYEALSIPSDMLRIRSGINRNFYTRLPEHLPPRVAATASSIAEKGGSNSERLALARDFFLSSNLRYATSNLPTGENHLDLFLFERKTGHCEYFASSLAILMRKAGVPARVVGGYYGGIYNEIGGYYVVSEEMAHAWVEIYIEGDGWKRVDPSRWSAGFADINKNRGKDFAARVSTFLDTFSYYWDSTVITFDLASQMKIARGATEMLSAQNLIKRLPWRMLLFLAATGAILAVFRLYSWDKTGDDEKLAIKFIRLSGLEYPLTGTGITEIAAGWNNADAERFASIYTSAIYNDRKLSSEERGELKRILSILKSLKSAKRLPPFA